MLNELSDYFFDNKIYDNLYMNIEGSLEEDNKFAFDKQIYRPVNHISANIMILPFVYDWIKNIQSITEASSCNLAAYYPPEGYFGWHTNDDCPTCYNMIATYSTSDKSYFETRKRKIYDTEEKISESALKNSSTKWAKKGSILIAMYGATAGKLSQLKIDATINQAISVVCAIEKFTLNEFLFFGIESQTKKIDFP